MRPAHLSPSGFKKMMTSGRKKDEVFGATAISYAEEIVQAMLGVYNDFTSAEMQWGIDNEPHAIKRYEMEKFTTVDQKQRIIHPKYDYISGEPDGLVDGGIIEVKCPNSANHFKNIIEGAQIELYKWQIQGYLWLTDRNWCDFVSYDPRYPVELQISINRVVRDEDMIQQLEERSQIFWHEIVTPLIQKVKQL